MILKTISKKDARIKALSFLMLMKFANIFCILQKYRKGSLKFFRMDGSMSNDVGKEPKTHKIRK